MINRPIITDPDAWIGPKIQNDESWIYRFDAAALAEIDAALAHEHAHWHGGRWLRSHALFIVRMLQCYHPVALWVFREYCIEVEVGCDHAAVAGRDPRALARVLVGIYDATDTRDLAARAAIRKRVDAARQRALQRQGKPNAQLTVTEIDAQCAPSALSAKSGTRRSLPRWLTWLYSRTRTPNPPRWWCTKPRV